MFQRSDGPVQYGLEPFDGERHVQLFRSDVARLAGRFIVRAEPQLAALRLEIERSVKAQGQRQGGRDRAVHPQLCDRAAQRLHAQRSDARSLGHQIGPGSRCIDQHPRLQGAPIGQFDSPAGRPMPRADHAGAAQQFGAQPLALCQPQLVQAGHVDVAAIRLVSANLPFAAQAGQAALQRGAAQRFDPHAERRKLAHERRQPFRLVRACQGECTAFGEQAVLVQKRARSRGQRLDPGPAIAFGPEGGGTARGMIAGAILRLDQGHPPMRRQSGRQRGPGDPRADNRKVEPFAHAAPMAPAMRFRKVSQAFSARSRTWSASRRIS